MSDVNNYTKFIIIGEERTGSTFLQMLLQSNPAIISMGEIFNTSGEIRKKSVGSTQVRPANPNENPISYVEKYIFKPFSDNIKAVGFRLFYTHAQNRKWAPIWQYIKDENLKILHLKRRNLLDRYLSLQMAYRTNEWVKTDAKKQPQNHVISIDIDDCAQSFHQSIWYQNKYDEFFENNPIIDLYYEDLNENTEFETRRIQDFLCLNYRPLYSVTKKQRTRSKPDVIRNYHELKQKFILGVEANWVREEWLTFFNEA